MEDSILGLQKCHIINDFKIKTSIMSSLLDDNIDNLNENPIDKNIIKNSNNYKIAYLSEGNNYILFLKKINNIFYTLLIKKNFKCNINDINFNNLCIYFLDATYNENLYNGTIIEGRLNKMLVFEVYNIIEFKGNKLNLDNINLNELNNKYFSINKMNFSELKDVINQSCEGIILIDKKINKIYTTYFNKNKKITKKYAILYMNKLNTDVFNLYCIKENNKYNIGIAHIPNIKTSLYFNKYDNEISVKCWYNETFNKWVPYELNDGKISNYNYIIDCIKKI